MKAHSLGCVTFPLRDRGWGEAGVKPLEAGKELQ